MRKHGSTARDDIVWTLRLGFDASQTLKGYVLIMTNNDSRSIRVIPHGSPLDGGSTYTGKMTRLDIDGAIVDKPNLAADGTRLSFKDILQSAGISQLARCTAIDAKHINGNLKELFFSEWEIQPDDNGYHVVARGHNNVLWPDTEDGAERHFQMDGPSHPSTDGAKKAWFNKWNLHFGGYRTTDGRITGGVFNLNRPKAKAQVENANATDALLDSAF
tara:strand:- start:780 stop:1430 length:651 start_codon:yes stop_codon:yes gene_type:complete